MTKQEITDLTNAIRDISFGAERTSGPGGLEGLSMALAGAGLHGNVCASLDGIASALEEPTDNSDIASALESIADAIENVATSLDRVAAAIK